MQQRPKRTGSLFSNHADELIGLHCATVFGNLHCIEAVDALVTSAKESAEIDISILSEIVEALGKIGDPRAINVIQNQLSHPSGNVRAHSIIALFRIDPLASIGLLKTMKNDPDPNVQRSLHKLTMEFQE